MSEFNKEAEICCKDNPECYKGVCCICCGPSFLDYVKVLALLATMLTAMVIYWELRKLVRRQRRQDDETYGNRNQGPSGELSSTDGDVISDPGDQSYGAPGDNNNVIRHRKRHPNEKDNPLGSNDPLRSGKDGERGQFDYPADENSNFLQDFTPNRSGPIKDNNDISPPMRTEVKQKEGRANSADSSSDKGGLRSSETFPTLPDFENENGTRQIPHLGTDSKPQGLGLVKSENRPTFTKALATTPVLTQEQKADPTFSVDSGFLDIIGNEISMPVNSSEQNKSTLGCNCDNSEDNDASRNGGSGKGAEHFTRDNENGQSTLGKNVPKNNNNNIPHTTVNTQVGGSEIPESHESKISNPHSPVAGHTSTKHKVSGDSNSSMRNGGISDDTNFDSSRSSTAKITENDLFGSNKEQIQLQTGQLNADGSMRDKGAADDNSGDTSLGSTVKLPEKALAGSGSNKEPMEHSKKNFNSSASNTFGSGPDLNPNDFNATTAIEDNSGRKESSSTVEQMPTSSTSEKEVKGAETLSNNGKNSKGKNETTRKPISSTLPNNHPDNNTTTLILADSERSGNNGSNSNQKAGPNSKVDLSKGDELSMLSRGKERGNGVKVRSRKERMKKGDHCSSTGNATAGSQEQMLLKRELGSSKLALSEGAHCDTPSDTLPEYKKSTKIDDTLVPGTVGYDVVTAVLRKMQRSGLPYDQSFLERVAATESNFGLDQDSSQGGIWKIEKDKFEATLRSTNLKELYRKLKTELNIEWDEVLWQNLEAPLYSGVAALLYVQSTTKHIPSSIKDQAKYYKDVYRRTANPERFVNSANKLQSTCSFTGPIDLCLVFDGSNSIRPKDFEHAKKFISNLVHSFPQEGVRFSIVRFDSLAETMVEMRPIPTSEMDGVISRIYHIGGSTNTRAGLLHALDQFKHPRPGVPKIMITLTDGCCNEGTGSLYEPLQKVSNLGITSIAVGIGHGINEQQLYEIALKDQSKVFHLSEYKNLLDFFVKVNREAAEVAQEHVIGNDVKGTLGPNEWRYFKFSLLGGSCPMLAELTCTFPTLAWYSYLEPNPNSAINDGQLTLGEHVEIPRCEGSKYVHMSIHNTSTESNDYVLRTK